MHGNVGLIDHSRRAWHANSTQIRASAIMMADKVWGSLLNLVVLAVMVGSYSPADFGRWSYVITVVQFVLPFLAVGAEYAIVRAIVQRPDDEGRILGSGAAGLFVASLVAAAAPLAYLFYVNSSDHEVIGLALLLTVANLPNALLIIEAAFKARTKPAPIVFVRIVALTLSAVIKIALSLAGVPIFWLGLAVIVEGFALGIGLLIAYRSSALTRARWKFDSAELRTIAIASLPLMIAAVTTMLFYRINHLLLAGTSTFHETGIYALAFAIVQASGLLPTAIITAYYPALVRLHDEDIEQFNQKAAWLYWWVALVGYAVLAIVASAAPFLESLLDERYKGLAQVLQVMMIGNLFMYLGGVRAAVINAINQSRLHLYASLIGLATVVPLTLFLIPDYGAFGAAIGVAVATFIATTASTVLFPGLKPTAKAQFRSVLLIPPVRQD